MVAALSLGLAKTRMGRGLRTIAEDSDTALLLVFDIGRNRSARLRLSGVFAALAGVLFALNYRQVQAVMARRWA